MNEREQKHSRKEPYVNEGEQKRGGKEGTLKQHGSRSWVEQQWPGIPGHTNSVRKQHVGIRLHKPWLSLESLLLEHQASQTKFSKIPNQARRRANIQGRWSGTVPATPSSSSPGVCLYVKISPDWSWRPPN